MRCLQCGKELALLKKFTDGEFCSPEHRTNFYDKLQRLILERLEHNGKRLKRSRLALRPEAVDTPVYGANGVAPDQTESARPQKAPEAVPAQPAEKLPPYAPLVPINANVYFRDCSTKSPITIQFEAAELILLPPALQLRDFRQEFVMAGGLIPDFPTAISSRRFSAVSVEVLEGKPQVQMNLLLAGLERSRTVPRTALPVTSQSLPVSSERPPISESMLADSRVDGLIGKPSMAAPLAAMPASEPSPLLQRPFRMRPRGPVQDPALARQHSINADLLPSGINDLIAASLSSEPAPEASPSMLDDFLGATLNTAVEATLPASVAIAADAMNSGGHPSAPRLTGDAGLTGPKVLTRPFMMRPRGPLQDKTLAGMHGVDMGTGVPLQSKAAVPGIPAVALTGPKMLDKPFRMRPRGPVHGTSPAFVAAETKALDAALSPEVPVSPAGGSSLSGPGILTRALVMRPRGPVQDKTLAGMHGVDMGSSAPLQSAAALPGTRTSEIAASPATLEKPFRMRPRGPVAGIALRTFDSIPTGVSEVLVSPARIPSLQVPACDALVPVAIERPLRMRPRGPVQARNEAALVPTVDILPEAFTGAVVLAACPAELIGECAPGLLDKPFRMRPRGPVQAKDLAASISAPGIPATLVSKPAVWCPAPPPLHYAPNAVERPFRMRPRGPVQGLSVSGFDIIEPRKLETAVPKAALRAMPRVHTPELAPVFRSRPLQMRPRGPVQDRTLSALEAISEAGQPLLSPAFINGLPASILGNCVPVPSAKPLRMRPRGPVQDKQAASFEHISMGPLEPLNSPASISHLPASIFGVCVPVLSDRPLRMRPRGPVQSTGLAAIQRTPVNRVDSGKLRPAIADQDCTISAGYAPNELTRPLRMRPRGPVASSGLLDFESLRSQAADGTPDLPVPPPVPVGVAEELIPVFLDHPYKMRPRGPVQAKDLDLFKRLGAECVAIETTEFAMPSMPAVLMRQATMSFRERPLKMRPRGPKASGGLSSYEQIEPAQAGDVISQASCMALPPNALNQFGEVYGSGQTVPSRGLSSIEKLYRMRPRGPVQSTETIRRAIAAGSEFSPQAILIRPASESFTGLFGSPSFAERLRALPPLESLSGRASVQIPCAAAEIVASMPAYASLRHSLAVGAQLQLPVDVAATQIVSADQMVLVDSHAAFAIEAIAVEPGEIFGPQSKWMPTMPAKPGAFRRLAASVRGRADHERLHAAIARWIGMPTDLKWAYVALIVLFAIYVHSVMRGSSMQEEQQLQKAGMTENPIPPIQDAVATKWPFVRQTLQNRAAIDFSDDFVNGLSNWDGEKGWQNSWVEDHLGGVKSGSLALYKPSMPLSNYQVEFMAGIEQKALGFVFRARDLKNYYAVKIVTVKGGRTPTMAIVRYAVIDGKQTAKTQTPLPFPVGRDTVYRVNLDVRDQFFTLMIQGHVVDFWSDERYKAGGVGFFSAKGEQARIQHIRVAHQDGVIGKLLASLFLENRTAK